MKFVPLFLLAMTIGCSKVATVPVSFNTSNDTTSFGAEPSKVELKHEDDGWVKVKVNVSDKKFDKLAEGRSVQVAMAEVPKGKYTAVRATFSVMGKDSTKGFGSGDRPSGNQNRAAVEYTAMTKTEFCAKGKKNNDLTITIRQNENESEPSIKVRQRPECK